MAPICTPGHSEPSQDLLEEPLSTGMRQKDGCGLLGWPGKCLDEAGGLRDRFTGPRWIIRGGQGKKEKNGGLAKLGWVNLSQMAGRNTVMCFGHKRWRWQRSRVGKKRWPRPWNMDTRRKINTATDKRRRKEFGIEREITDPTPFKLLFHIFTTCSKQPGLKFPIKNWRRLGFWMLKTPRLQERESLFPPSVNNSHCLC